MDGPSCSSSSLPIDVFLNFRGEDTRKSFVCHLHDALKRETLRVYMDKHDLKKGDDLSIHLLKAIAESKLSIVVFSENYATSTWCLKELVKILGCMKNPNQNQIVIPIFYKVDPSDIRKQSGSFAKAFAKLEADRKKDQKLLREVQTWRSALKEATGLAGYDSQNYEDDAELIDDIVSQVFQKVNRITPLTKDGLVAMDFHLNKMKRLLNVVPNDVVYVGIWGMGGLGKTTIADAVFRRISHKFDHSCFLRDVRKGFETKGKVQMQLEFLSGIHKRTVNEREGSDHTLMLKSLRNKRILVVLDDVSRSFHIDDLLGIAREHAFGCGSKVIVTTRDEQVVRGFQIYKPKPLSDPKALELFYQSAFRKKQPPSEEYEHLSKRAIKHAHGLPLALKTFGALLGDKDASEWNDVLDKIKELPDQDIKNVLKVSFDGLDAYQKNIFLDIACFFKGMHREYVEIILNSCGFRASSGLRVLIDRALVSISKFGALEIHDFLQEIGKEIVCEKPWKHSRLWSYEDVQDTFTKNKAMKVEAVMIELSGSEEIHVNAEAFDSMMNLRLLRITYPQSMNDFDTPFKKYFEGESWPERIYKPNFFCKFLLNGDLMILSHKLKVLAWHSCPLKSLPSKFDPKHLVDLDMRHSRIEQLWPEPKAVKDLISINLSRCYNLKEIPLCTEAPKLEKLILDFCKSLVQVSPSISAFNGLSFLSLVGCTGLRSLPRSIHLKSLKNLVLSYCSNLEMFPEISEALSVLMLDHTAIKEIPLCTEAPKLEKLILDDCKSLVQVSPSISAFNGLTFLSLVGCTKLRSLPRSIHLKSLKTLVLSGCLNLEMFPEISEDMEALLELKLNGTAIKELPSSIERLRGLRLLNLEECTSLVCLPDSICNLSELTYLYLSGCSKLCCLPMNIGNLESLRELHVNRTGIKRLPASVSISHLLYGFLSSRGCKQMEAPLSSWPSNPSSVEGRRTDVVQLDFTGCNLLDLSNFISHCSSLKVLLLSRNDNLESLPACVKRLDFLEQLDLQGCKRLKSIPELSSRISYINAHGCTALETVSTPKSPYRIGRCFKFSNCSHLVHEYLFRDIVETHLPPKGTCSRPFYLSFPGSEFPGQGQFIHQCPGSSVTAKLPQNFRFNKQLLGFAIYAVINKHQNVDYCKLTAQCLCTFRGNGCKYRFSFCLFDSYFDSFRHDGLFIEKKKPDWLESSHVLVGYVPWSEFDIHGEQVNERHYTEAKFEIELVHKLGGITNVIFDSSMESREPCIERCGVRFFFDNNEDEEVAYQDLRESLVQVDNSEIRSFEGCSTDEEEQHLKLSEVFEGADRAPRNEDNDKSRKRRTLASWAQKVGVTSGLMQGHLDDGFNWLPSPGTTDIRYGSYHYVCRVAPGCLASATARHFIDDRTIFEITYDGRHTCLETQPMLTYKVRVTPGMGTEGFEAPFDGFTWGVYGQTTNVQGAVHTRVYYVCTPEHVGGCMAIKEVQRSQDQKILKITYRGRHTCIKASDSIGKKYDI